MQNPTVPEHHETEADEPANREHFRALIAPSPLGVAARRQARLIQEYTTPKYSTSTPEGGAK